jgi:hypothetical protein
MHYYTSHMDIDMAIANLQPYAHPKYIEALAPLLIPNCIVLPTSYHGGF